MLFQSSFSTNCCSLPSLLKDHMFLSLVLHISCCLLGSFFLSSVLDSHGPNFSFPHTFQAFWQCAQTICLLLLSFSSIVSPLPVAKLDPVAGISLHFLHDLASRSSSSWITCFFIAQQIHARALSLPFFFLSDKQTFFCCKPLYSLCSVFVHALFILILTSFYLSAFLHNGPQIL